MQITDSKNKAKVKKLVLAVCPWRKIQVRSLSSFPPFQTGLTVVPGSFQVLPYGPDICAYFTEDRVDDVVGGIIDDYPSKDLCNALAEGKDPWFQQCE